MANLNITDLPGGTFGAGHKFEMFNTAANQNQSVTIPAQSVQTQNLFDLTLSGNTAGALALISSGTATLAGGDNITLSQNGNAVTIIGAAAGTGGGIAATLGGNTAGTLALISTGTMFLAGGNNVTLSQNGNSVTVSAASQSAQTQNLFALTLAGNTAGALALISSGTATLVGGDNVTLSQNGNAITVIGASGGGGAAASPEYFHNYPWIGQSVTNSAITRNSLGVFPLCLNGLPFPGVMTPATVNLWVSSTGSTATESIAFTASLYLAVYTRNGETLNLLNSVSTSWGSGANNNSISNSFAGIRIVSFHSSQWSTTPAFSQGHYYIGYLFQSAGASAWQTQHVIGFQDMNSALQHKGYMGDAQLAGSDVNFAGFMPFYGNYSTSTVGIPTTIGTNELSKNQTQMAYFMPIIQFNNQITRF